MSSYSKINVASIAGRKSSSLKTDQIAQYIAGTLSIMKKLVNQSLSGSGTSLVYDKWIGALKNGKEELLLQFTGLKQQDKIANDLIETLMLEVNRFCSKNNTPSGFIRFGDLFDALSNKRMLDLIGDLLSKVALGDSKDSPVLDMHEFKPSKPGPMKDRNGKKIRPNSSSNDNGPVADDKPLTQTAYILSNLLVKIYASLGALYKSNDVNILVSWSIEGKAEQQTDHVDEKKYQAWFDGAMFRAIIKELLDLLEQSAGGFVSTGDQRSKKVTACISEFQQAVVPILAQDVSNSSDDDCCVYKKCQDKWNKDLTGKKCVKVRCILKRHVTYYHVDCWKTYQNDRASDKLKCKHCKSPIEYAILIKSLETPDYMHSFYAWTSNNKDNIKELSSSSSDESDDGNGADSKLDSRWQEEELKYYANRYKIMPQSLSGSRLKKRSNQIKDKVADLMRIAKANSTNVNQRQIGRQYTPGSDLSMLPILKKEVRSSSAPQPTGPVAAAPLAIVNKPLDQLDEQKNEPDDEDEIEGHVNNRSTDQEDSEHEDEPDSEHESSASEQEDEQIDQKEPMEVKSVEQQGIVNIPVHNTFDTLNDQKEGSTAHKESKVVESAWTVVGARKQQRERELPSAVKITGVDSAKTVRLVHVNDAFMHVIQSQVVPDLKLNFPQASISFEKNNHTTIAVTISGLVVLVRQCVPLVVSFHSAWLAKKSSDLYELWSSILVEHIAASTTAQNQNKTQDKQVQVNENKQDNKAKNNTSSIHKGVVRNPKGAKWLVQSFQQQMDRVKYPRISHGQADRAYAQMHNDSYVFNQLMEHRASLLHCLQKHLKFDSTLEAADPNKPIRRMIVYAADSVRPGVVSFFERMSRLIRMDPSATVEQFLVDEFKLHSNTNTVDQQEAQKKKQVDEKSKESELDEHEDNEANSPSSQMSDESSVPSPPNEVVTEEMKQAEPIVQVAQEPSKPLNQIEPIKQTIVQAIEHPLKPLVHLDSIGQLFSKGPFINLPLVSMQPPAIKPVQIIGHKTSRAPINLTEFLQAAFAQTLDASLAIQQVDDIFRKNQVDLEALMEMNRQDLIDLSILTGPAIKLEKYIRLHKAGELRINV